MAAQCGNAVRDLGAGDPPLIRIAVLWLSTEPMGMRAGAERLLARVVQVFASRVARPGGTLAALRLTAQHGLMTLLAN